MTLTVDDLRDHVESSLGDDALGLLLDAAYEAIDRAIGAAGNVTERLTAGPGDRLMLSRPASAVVSVTEDDTAIASNDFTLIGDQLLLRLETGTNPRYRWLNPVQVTYTLESDADERDRAAIALVRLDLDFRPGVQSERLGDHSITFASGSRSYLDQRDGILASLASGFVAK